MQKKEKPKAEQSEPYLKLIAGSPTIEGNLEGVVLLCEDERRIFNLARGISLEGLPPHRQKALKDMLDAYRTDFVMTKVCMTLRNEGMI